MPDDKKVTAPVTPPKKPKEKTPWENAGLTKAEWDALEIPAALRRSSPSAPASPPSPASSPTPKSAAAPAAPPSSGSKTGSAKSTTTSETPSKTTPKSTSGGLLDFQKWRVDPEDIERKIRQEADRRWREWTPTADDARKGIQTRPRLSVFIKQARKEFYP